MPFLNLGYNIFKLLDKGFIEKLGPLGSSFILYKWSFFMNKLSNKTTYFNISFFTFFFFFYLFCLITFK